MESQKTRFRYSLRWIAGMLTEEASCHHAIPILLDPYSQTGQLKRQLVSTLTEPVLYGSVLAAILPAESVKPCEFSSLIHCLARHGVYVLEDEDVPVTHSVLAQRKPFREASHLALMEGLMALYSKSVVNVHQIVKTVKHISRFVASKDLPYQVDDSLVLWLNKVSQAVAQSERAQRESQLQVTDARQRRRSRLQLLGAEEPFIPPITDLWTGVADGQCLGALLVYYVPQSFKWTDFHFSKLPLTKHQIIENVSKVIEFSTRYLPPPGFHIDKEVLIQSQETEVLKPNIQALVAHLYLCLEIKKSPEANDLPAPANTDSPDTNAIPLAQRAGSTPTLNDSHQQSGTRESLPGKAQVLNRTTGATRDVGRANLQSTSDTALTHSRQQNIRGSFSGRYPSERTSVFKPSIRESMSSAQVTALAGFSSNHPKPSKPSTQVLPTAERAPLKSSSSHELISAATETLMLREQMLGAGAQVSLCRVRRSSKVPSSISSSESGSTADLHTTSTSRVADVSDNCTESWRNQHSQEQPANSGLAKLPAVSHVEPIPLVQSVDPEPPSKSRAVHYYIELSENEQPEERRSFTVDTNQTYASAVAAGLPIIKSEEKLFTTQPESSQTPAHQTVDVSAGRSSSGSSCTSSGPSVVHVDIVINRPPALDYEQSEAEASPAIKALIRKVEDKVSEINERHQLAMRQEQAVRKRVGRMVLLATKENTEQTSKQSGLLQQSAPILTAPSQSPPEPLEPPSPTIPTPQQRQPSVHSLSKFPFSPITPLNPSSHVIPEPNHPPQPSVSFTQHALNEPGACNPWTQETKSPLKSQAGSEEAMKRKEAAVRARLEERERARKIAQENRRKTQASARALQELARPDVTSNMPASKLQLGVEVKDTTTHVHYQLSSQTVEPAEEDRPSLIPVTGRVSDFLSHNGPGCYVQPQAKSNKKLIKNALCYVCLAGDANLTMKQRALTELESTSANHVFVLFRNIIGFKFRALYSYSPEHSQVSKIFGSGPKVIKSHMVSHLYKYNSGLKEFKEIPSRTFSVSVDALTIQNEYWLNRRSLAKPPPGPHR